MSERVKFWSVGFLGLLAAASLSIGARTALAHSPTMDCAFIPPYDLGSCTDNTDCQRLCDIYNTPGTTSGVCNGAHCCHCFT